MKKLLCILCLSVVGFSCIKKEYDLDKDMDLTMKVGGDNLYIPIGSTDTIFLKKFLKTDDIDMLEVLANGGYGIAVRDSNKLDIPAIDTTQLKVADIVENQHENIDFSAVLSFPSVVLPSIDETYPIKSGLADVTDPGYTGIPVSSLPITPTVSARDSVDISINQELPSAILGVDSILLTNPANIKITLTPENLPTGIEVTLDSIVLVFPKQIKLGADPGVSGQTYKYKSTTPLSGPLNLTIPIRCLDFSSTPLRGQDLVLEDKIRILSTYSLSGTYNGNWPTQPNDAGLTLKVQSNLNFGSATVRLDKVEESLPKTSVPVQIAANDIPNEIVSLDSILLQNMQIKLALNLSQTKIGGKDMNTHVKVKFPKDLMFNSADVSAANIFEKDVTFDAQGKWNTTLNVRGLKFDGQPLGGSINIDDSITFEANVVVNNPVINTDTLLNTNLSVDVEAKVTNIKFSKVFGKINPDIPSQNISVDLAGLSDELPTDSIVLDVKPYLDLTMKSNLQIPFGATVVLKPWKDGSIIPGGEQQVGIDVPKSANGLMKNTKFWIADTNTAPSSDYTFVQANLGAVIKHIPDSIQITVEAGTDPNEQAIFDLNAQYKADLNYNFVVPFAFGSDLKVVIQDTINNLSETIGKLLNGNNIGLSGTIYNSIPLDLEATIIPIDGNNKPIVGIEYPKLIIDAGDDKGAATAKRLDISFNDSNKKLSEMRGIIFIFSGRTGARTVGVPIKPDNFIKVILNAKVIGGMTIDLNDLTDKED